MRNFTTLLGFLITFCCYSQFFDDFDNQSQTESNNWGGETEKFIIDNLNGILWLSDKNGASTTYISAYTGEYQSRDSLRWDFYAGMKFKPSSQNYIKVYIASDSPNLKGELNGYYVLLGYSKYEVSLYRQEGLAVTPMIVNKSILTDDINSNEVAVCVEKTSGNEWYLSFKTYDGDIVHSGPYKEESSLVGKYLGPCITYTKTRSEHSYFDFFKFSIESNAGVDPPVTPDPDPDPDPVPDPDTGDSFIPSAFGDIVITEIMANPKGITLLPEVEYVEIHNRSGKSANMKDSRFYYGAKPYIMPEVIIEDGEYAVIYNSKHDECFGSQVKSIMVESFPQIANTGKLLMIENPTGVLLHWVEFSDKWYADTQKKNGGFSLEAVDIDNLNPSQYNWRAATESGTPGVINSVAAPNPDNERPFLQSRRVNADGELELTFSKPMNPESINAGRFNEANNGLFESSYSDYPKNLGVTLTPYSEQTVILPEAICISGLPVFGKSFTPIGDVENADAEDLLFNELLFTPVNDAEAFVELVNVSGKSIDLSELYISTITSTGTTGTRISLADSSTIISPGEYVLITLAPSEVFERYNYKGEPQIVVPSKLPELNEKSGRLAITNKDGLVIDKIAYSTSLHTSTGIPEGLSLERDQLASASGWHSASALEKGATPGYLNSSGSGASYDSLMISDRVGFTLPLSKVRITDGYPESSLVVSYNLSDQQAGLASITLYDTRGVRLHRVISNLEIEGKGIIELNDEWRNEQTQYPGLLIMLIELKTAGGRNEHYKMPLPVVP